MRQRPLDSQILRRFNIRRMSEYFRRVIIKFFLKKNLISATLATSLSTSGWSTHPAVGVRHLPGILPGTTCCTWRTYRWGRPTTGTSALLLKNTRGGLTPLMKSGFTSGLRYDQHRFHSVLAAAV